MTKPLSKQRVFLVILLLAGLLLLGLWINGWLDRATVRKRACIHETAAAANLRALAEAAGYYLQEHGRYPRAVQDLTMATPVPYLSEQSVDLSRRGYDLQIYPLESDNTFLATAVPDGPAAYPGQRSLCVTEEAVVRMHSHNSAISTYAFCQTLGEFTPFRE